MAAILELREAGPGEAPALSRVVDILGGSGVLKQQLTGPLDTHELLLHGLPVAALTHLVDGLALLHDPASLEKAVGISLRTYQRHKASPARPLTSEQSSRTWEFAEILATATAVFGSRRDAELWLESPAIGLDQRRPIDLLATTAGRATVEEHLERLEFGVYT